MPSLGILAYGSLIDEPGGEITPLIAKRVKTTTPFLVEFARKSTGTRGGAPTLVPVRKGGARVSAQILVLRDDVTHARAADLLWRR